jgi:cytochrome c-type biogenesis protein CcsB
VRSAFVRSLPRSIACAALVACALATARAADGQRASVDASALDGLVVLSGGRLKPFPTLAREEVRHIVNARRFLGQDPTETYLSVLFESEKWLAMKCLPPDRTSRAIFAGDLLSPNEVLEFWDARLAAFRDMQKPGADQAHGALEQERARLQALWDEIEPLYSRADAVRTAAADLRVIPDTGPGGTEGEWLTEDEARAAIGKGAAALAPAVDALAALKKAYAERDGAAFDDAARALKGAQRSIAAESGRAILSEAMLRFENLYYAVDFRAIGLALFVAATIVYLMAGLLRCRMCGLGAAALFGTGIAWTTWIVAGHTAIAGRLPLKNLHEVYLVVLFFVPLIGLVLRTTLGSTLYLGVAAALTALGFTGALFLPPDGYAIAPLVAILHSPWREIHILTIMLSYAIFLVAFGLHVAFLVAAARSARGTDGALLYSPVAEDLHRNAVLTVGWGFLFLTVGIATGAAWANSSWGRYWGWDPKEVWATVAWLIYAVLLHLRVFFKTRREVLAALNVLGFAAIIFTYFGVTYLLSGLHAYR